MASIIGKAIRGQTYYYLREVARVNGKPKIISQRYLGKAADIEAAVARFPIARSISASVIWLPCGGLSNVSVSQRSSMTSLVGDEAMLVHRSAPTFASRLRTASSRRARSWRSVTGGRQLPGTASCTLVRVHSITGGFGMRWTRSALIS